MSTAPNNGLEDFLHGYLVSALWTSLVCDEEGNDCTPMDDDYSVEDIDAKSVAGCKSVCADFIESNIDDLLQYVERMKDSQDFTAWGRAGHDFWLTRNGHGCGFWDRGLGELGDKLSKAAKVYKEQDAYAGDDGKIYFSGFENFKETV